tara:strand:+ start:1689 stop:3224 length:1536 start_codon:yes stop_codon:yes gene_type:complete
MRELKAKILFRCENPAMARSKPFLAATAVLQRHCRVHHTILAGTNVIWTSASAIPTAATDGYHIYINEAFFRSLPNASQRAFLLGHEVAHIMLQHCPRGKAYSDRGYFRNVGNATIPFNAKFWNEDGDAGINADLIAHGLEMIDGGILLDSVTRESWIDDVYLSRDWSNEKDDKSKRGDPDGNNKPSNKIDDDDFEDANTNPDGGEQSVDDGGDQAKPKSGESNGQGDDDDIDQVDSGSSGDSPLQDSTKQGHDVHLVPQYDGTEQEIKDAKESDTEVIDTRIDQALDDFNQSFESGEHDQKRPSATIAASGGRAKATNVSSIRWREQLADRVTKKSGGSTPSWARINRRKFINTGIVSPSTKGTFLRMGLTMDTSYSCMRYSETVDQFINEAASLIDCLSPSSGAVLIQCGDDVRKVDEVMSGSELLDLEIKEGGGTYMAASVEWLEANGLDCDIHLIFTDGWMLDADYKICADAGAILVLVKHPDAATRRSIAESGIDYIIACDDPLAA